MKAGTQLIMKTYPISYGICTSVATGINSILTGPVNATSADSQLIRENLMLRLDHKPRAWWSDTQGSYICLHCGKQLTWNLLAHRILWPERIWRWLRKAV